MLEPGLIGLACGEQNRYSDFIPSLISMHKPAGTAFVKASGLGPAVPFNIIGRIFMQNPMYKWLFLTNDDNLCPIDTIPRLLAHNVDVVSGLYFGRIMPFEPILFDKVTLEHDAKGVHKWYWRHLMQNGEKGLVPAVAVGDGCLLIRRHVMEALSDPWWEYGETLTELCDHDVIFSRKVREAGFGLFCDLDLLVDHIANFVIRPYRAEDGVWKVRLVQGGDERTLEVEAVHGSFTDIL